MVAPAELEEVVEAGRAAVGPVLDVVASQRVRPQPGKRQPPSRWARARHRAGETARVRRPTSSTDPSAAWRITTFAASQARRRDVSAETSAASSTAATPVPSAESASASTWTTTW
jgi:hypothetical protein